MTDRLGYSRSPDLSEVIQAAIAAAIGEMCVALPGAVQTYDAATQTADVLPMLQLPVVFEDGSESEDALPVIPSVPIVFPRAGDAFISFPIKPGDLVLLVFVDRSIDKYKTGGGTIPLNPIDLRQHDLSDAVAIPGFYSLPKALKDGVLNQGHLALGYDKGGIQIHLKPDGSCEIVNTAMSLVVKLDGSITFTGPVGNIVMNAAGIFSVNGNLQVLP